MCKHDGFDYFLKLAVNCNLQVEIIVIICYNDIMNSNNSIMYNEI